MKKITLLSAVLAAVFFMSCKKTRTCSCTTTMTSVNTQTPRNGGTVQSNTSASTGKGDESYAKVTKKDMRKLANCNSRTETSVSTYTTGSSVFTGSTQVTTITDVSTTETTEYDCDIK